MRTIVVAGTSSGVGKTTIALGMMAAYARRGLRVQPFKVGPDFLDPLLHKAATGRASYNLDDWMLCRDVNLACFLRCSAFTDIAIVEGVMGLYDGRDGKSEAGSTAQMAKLLDAPVLLVLDCWALSRSAAAVIRGYTTFDLEVKFSGVVFNKVGGPSHTAWLKDAISTTEPGVRILGGVPKTTGIELPERHLGLRILNNDEESPVNYIQQLADLIELHVDLDAVLEQAGVPDSLNSDQGEAPTSVPVQFLQPKHVRIGIAQDEAFCFYYHENLILLQGAGAELVYFSPLKDSLPPRLDGIYFGGGYPELHLEQLNNNKRMMYAIRAFANAGGVVFAECGGLMYLSQGIEDQESRKWTMCGVFPFWTRVQAIMHIGYVVVIPQDNCVLFPPDVGEIRGQLYHFCEIFYTNKSPCPKGFLVKAEYQKLSEDLEGFMHENTMASFVHLHFGSNPDAVHSLVERCRIDSTKAAAVAAASASAVAGAGPAAAAAAGAAAATAVTEALGETKELVSYQVSKSGEDFATESMLRRSQSFVDPSYFREAADVRKISDRLVRSESEVGLWRNSLDPPSSSMGSFNHNIISKENLSSDSSLSVMPKYAFSGKNSITAGPGNNSVNIAKETRDRSSIGTTLFIEDAKRPGSENHESRKLSVFTHRQSEQLGNGQLSSNLNFGRSRMSTSNTKELPRKIVSLMPSATEILVKLGAGRRLIGITDLCVNPCEMGIYCQIVCFSMAESSSRSKNCVEILKKSVTSGTDCPFRLDVSWLCKEKPDLIVIQGDSHSSSVVQVLAQAGLVDGETTSILALKPHTVANILASIIELGDVVGLYKEACLLVDWLKVRLRKVASATAKLYRPRVLLLVGLDPLLMGGLWLHEMVTLAGGFDALQKPGCSPERILWQRIINYAPEVLILAPCSVNMEQSLSEVEKLARLSGFWSIPAVEAGRVYICDHSFFSNSGLLVVDGVELLAFVLHPSLTRGLPFPEAVLKLTISQGQRCNPGDLSQYFQPWS